MDRTRRVSLRRLGRELARAILDGLCPPGCAACGQRGPDPALCRPCRALLEARPRPWCARCGEPLAAADAPCRADHRELAGIAWARAPLAYRGTGGELVRRLKFRHDRAAGLYLARAMAGAAGEWARGPGRRVRVVTVPLHPKKLRARGLDQAALLAEEVARELGLEFAPGCLRRLRDTLPQGDPRVTSRRANVEGAFAVRRPAAIRGRDLLLIDDVVTSGTTARECARVLRRAGARQVALLTAAHA